MFALRSNNLTPNHHLFALSAIQHRLQRFVIRLEADLESRPRFAEFALHLFKADHVVTTFYFWFKIVPKKMKFFLVTDAFCLSNFPTGFLN